MKKLLFILSTLLILVGCKPEITGDNDNTENDGYIPFVDVAMDVETFKENYPIFTDKINNLIFDWTNHCFWESCKHSILTDNLYFRININGADKTEHIEKCEIIFDSAYTILEDGSFSQLDMYTQMRKFFESFNLYLKYI